MNTLAYRPQNLKRSILSPTLPKSIGKSLIPRFLVAILAWDRASFRLLFMSMSIRANLLFVILAALAANAFASSDGCSTQDTNMLLQAQKIMTTPKDENRSLVEWKRYRRRFRWSRRQHSHGYYVPEKSTTVAATTSSTSTTTATSTTTTRDISSCSGAKLLIVARPNVVTLPDANFTTFSANPDPPEGCCPLQAVFVLQISLSWSGEDRPESEFQASIKSPISADIPRAIVASEFGVAFQLPETQLDGFWELDFFYPSEWIGLEVNRVEVRCFPQWSGPPWG